MKKKLMITILALSLVALLAATLVACNPTDNKGGDDGLREFESGKYTVTFDTKSEMVLSNPKLTDIPYGTKIEEPKTSDGTVIKPVKRGYDFVGWSADGKNVFDFKNTPITKSLTLSAMYKARTFIHTAVLGAKLVYNESDGSFTINKTARPGGEIGLEANAKLETTYDELSNLPSPTSSNPDNKFVFWYYMQDGKPVQLTRWKEADKADVNLLTKYNLTQSLEIYPMFTDNLPRVTVEYADSITPAKYDSFTQSIVFGDNIPESQKPDPTEFQHGEYSFDYWYYTVKEEDKNGNEISTETIFVYDGDNVKNPTSPVDAAGATENFTPKTLTLYAKWTKEIKIGNVENDFMDIYNKLRNTTPTSQEKAEIERILSANIKITADLDFENRELEPLFDSEHIFTGTIDGGVYNDSNVVIDRYTIRGGQFGNKTEASVFGYNDGRISNLRFVGVGLKIVKDELDNYADYVQMGFVTTQNRGTIHNCTVVFSDMRLDGFKTVVFGSVTAVNRLKDNTTGAITSCIATATSFAANCEALTFGGIAGISYPNARLSKCTANVTVSSVVCTDDGISSNGRSSLVMGGLVGNNSGYIALSIVQRFDVTEVESFTDFSFGGVVGVNTGSIRTSHSTATLCSEQAPANVSGSLSQTVGIGGLAGRNEGYAVNSYCDITAYAQIKSAPQSGCNVSVGGIMGNNYSDKKDTSSSTTSGIGAINSCYATGSIYVKVAEELKNVTVYAGGIAGRNTHSKLSSLFTAVNITVENGGKNNIGYVLGSRENGSALKTNCYYIDETKLRLNGVDYRRIPVGDGDDELDAFPITEGGSVLLKSKFGDDSVLTTLGFTKDDPWMIDENYDYPIFNNKIYN